MYFIATWGLRRSLSHTRFTDLTVSCTQINVSQVRRLRINKWAEHEGPGLAQQLWRQIFPLWISKAGKGVFGEETEGRFVPFSDRSALPISPPIPLSLSLCQSSSPKSHLPAPSSPCALLELTQTSSLKRCYRFSAVPSCSSLLNR